MAEKDSAQKDKIELIVKEAQKGSTEAFGKLYDLYVNQIYRYISFKVSKEDALDLTETVFLKVWEHVASYKKGSGTFASWIFRIAHNLVIDHYRLQRHHASLDDVVLPDEKREADPAFLTENKFTQAMLKKAIAKLNPKYQQILLLRYITGLEPDEIGKIMNRSPGSLRILKFRALQSLKKILEDMGVRY